MLVSNATIDMQEGQAVLPNLEEFGIYATSNYNALSAVPEASPIGLRLYSCVPNPFNPMTTFSYDLPQAESVFLRVYDVSGRLVRVVEDGALVLAGHHEAQWDGRDDEGRPVPAGVYLYRLQAGFLNESKRMVLVK